MLRTLFTLTAFFVVLNVMPAQNRGVQKPFVKTERLVPDSTVFGKNSDYGRFSAEAEELSNLYRGVAPVQYRFRYTGSCFAYSDEFERGFIIYNGRIYRNVLLNLNCHTDELVVKIEKSGILVKLNKDFVDCFSLGKRVFVNLGRVPAGNTDVMGIASVSGYGNIEGAQEREIDKLLPSGYYEVIYDGELKLLKKIKKVYSERINQSVNVDTGSQIDRYFTTSTSYYLMRDKKLGRQDSGIRKEIVGVKRKASLYSSIRENKNEVRQQVRKLNLPKNNKDLIYKSILEYAESLENRK